MKTFSFFMELATVILVALIVVLPIRFFIFQPFRVRGSSMEPTFREGDYIIVDEISMHFRELKRGDIVVFRSPTNKFARYIKRIVGLPGETVVISGNRIRVMKDSNLLFSDERQGDEMSGDIEVVVLHENEYFVLGDNRAHSFDSRSFGPVNKRQIIGRVVLRLWPLNSVTVFSSSPILSQ